ncbi:MAG: hypothetical protein ACRCX2_01055 [Paraclostridium sp.]
MITILSIVMIVLGFLLVVGTIKEKYDKTYEGEYNKTNFFINLGEGLYSIIIGLLAMLNIISEKRFSNLMILLCVFNIVINFKNKK